MSAVLIVGQKYRVSHEQLGVFFGRCTVVDGDFIGFEIVEGNFSLLNNAYKVGDGFYTHMKYCTIEER